MTSCTTTPVIVGCGTAAAAAVAATQGTPPDWPSLSNRFPLLAWRHSSVRSDRTALLQEAIPPDEPLKLAGWLLPPAGAWLSTGLEPATRVARRWLSAILALLSFLQVGPPLDRRLLALMLLDKLSFERPPGCVDVRHVSDEILDVADSPSRCSGRTVESRRA